MHHYAEEMCMAKNIRLNYISKLESPFIEPGMEQSHQLYLIAKEAINNAVKYSGASVLDLSITEANNLLYFAIEDNGSGFETSKAANGNGLRNMRNRAEKMGAALDLQSAEGKGTTFKLFVKLTQ